MKNKILKKTIKHISRWAPIFVEFKVNNTLCHR